MVLTLIVSTDYIAIRRLAQTVENLPEYTHKINHQNEQTATTAVVKRNMDDKMVLTGPALQHTYPPYSIPPSKGSRLNSIRRKIWWRSQYVHGGGKLSTRSVMRFVYLHTSSSSCSSTESILTLHFPLSRFTDVLHTNDGTEYPSRVGDRLYCFGFRGV